MVSGFGVCGCGNIWVCGWVVWECVVYGVQYVVCDVWCMCGNWYVMCDGWWVLYSARTLVNWVWHKERKVKWKTEHLLGYATLLCGILGPATIKCYFRTATHSFEKVHTPDDKPVLLQWEAAMPAALPHIILSHAFLVQTSAWPGEVATSITCDVIGLTRKPIRVAYDEWGPTRRGRWMSTVAGPGRVCRGEVGHR